MIKKCETCEFKYKDCDVYHEQTSFKYNFLEYNCLCCSKNCKKSCLKKAAWKGAYQYEYMNDWGKFSETSLSEEEDLYSHFNMEDITNAGYTQGKRVCKYFEIKHLGEHHVFYVQNNTLLLADIFENLWNICLEIYEPDPVCFLTAPGLAWQVALKKTKVKLDITNI